MSGTTLPPDLSELAYGCRILHNEGHADMTLGHLALRDPDGRGVWVKRSGIGLGECVGTKAIPVRWTRGRRLL